MGHIAGAEAYATVFSFCQKFPHINEKNRLLKLLKNKKVFHKASNLSDIWHYIEWQTDLLLLTKIKFYVLCIKIYKLVFVS